MPSSCPWCTASLYRLRQMREILRLPGESAIKVLPIRLATADAADHYKLGWEDREQLVMS